MTPIDLFNQRAEMIEKQNSQYLELFEKSLQGKLSEKVIRRHISNMEMFLNVYLTEYAEFDWSVTTQHEGDGDEEEGADIGPAPMEAGMGEIDEYLGYFMIRKIMWSTPSTIKSSAASIKKFYQCMLDNRQFGQLAPLTEEKFREEYESMLQEIKVCMEDWQADCAQYNDPSQPNPFDPFSW